MGVEGDAGDTDSQGTAGARSWRNRKDRVPSTPLRLTDLPPAARRRAIVRSGVTIALCWVFIVGAFYVVPIGHESGLRAFTRLAADIALIGAVFAWQIRRISVAELPELRAIEALGIVIVLFLVAFSGLYLGMSHQAVLSFSRSLDQTQALYFTITIFSTVGFGDIVPRTDPARLVVSAQMLLDLAIIGAVVRLIFNTAKNRVAPAAAPAPAAPGSATAGTTPAAPAAPAET